MPQCIFCEIISQRRAASVVVARARLLAFMDIFPLRPGHLLIVPRQHAQRVAELDPELRGELWELGVALGSALRRSSLPCRDVHLLINDGSAANQSVPHVHLHVIPRSGGDLRGLIGRAAAIPLGPLRRTARRERLDAQAAEIGAALEEEVAGGGGGSASELDAATAPPGPAGEAG